MKKRFVNDWILLGKMQKLQYDSSYNAFGDLTYKSGSMADEFAFRFSTKYYDAESDLYYYTYRYYNPQLMRWLTEDPIAEDGGLNLYGFCGNNPVCRYDKDGRAYFAKRQLSGFGWHKRFSQNTVLDVFNIEVSHEHLFFGTPGNPLDDIGYFKKGGVRHDSDKDKYHYVVVDTGYNDCVMRKAVAQVAPKPYCTLGFVPRRDNCQSYAQQLRNKYHNLMEDEKVLCECFGKHKKGNYIWMR